MTALPPFTVLGLGTAMLGNHRKAMTDDDASAVLEAAWAAGIRHFDTAPHYGLGLAEKRLGTFLADKPRAEFVVSTKVGRELVPRSDAGSARDDHFLVPATHRRRWDFTAAGIERTVDGSRERLGLDTLDVLYLHDPERWNLQSALRSGLPALAQLRDRGVTTCLGVGSMSTPALAAAARHDLVDVLMAAGRYTLADPSLPREVLPHCRDRELHVVAAAVFNGGLLSTEPGPESTFDYGPVAADVLERVLRIAAVCANHAVPLRVAAVQYPLRDPSVVSVVVGGDTPDQVRENVAATAAAVPADLWSELRGEGLIP